MMPFHHPAGFYHGHSHFHFGYRRIFWFAIGAATVVWWNRHREGHFCGGRRQYERLEQGHVDQGSLQDVSPEPVRFAWSWKASAPQISNPPSTAEWWDKEKDRLADVGKQANEAVSEMSESAIDAVLAKLHLLKAKLAEDREQREQSKRKQIKTDTRI